MRHGAVVATSTRPDNITITLDARRKRGPVAIFDPNNSPRASPVVCAGHPYAAAKTPHSDDPHFRHVPPRLWRQERRF